MTANHQQPPCETDTFVRITAMLRLPSSYRAVTSRPVDHVEVHETHGAVVFLAADVAVKIKRPVRLAYLDFSSRAQREAALRRELEINQTHAPMLYREVLPITCDGHGDLTLAGDGKTIEWALLMRRFPPGALLSEMAEDGRVPDGCGRALADMLAAMHAGLAPIYDADATARLESIIENVATTLARDPSLATVANRFTRLAKERFARVASLLAQRVGAGSVRRCHGDLHLANIVWLDERPVAFDAIEFDEALATIDVLYDLAFTLMDLDRHGLVNVANAMLNRWLWRASTTRDLDGLAALPLLLALRAGVRAMVTLDRASQLDDGETAARERRSATAAAHRACAYLTPPPAALVAVGGLSGTGKSTLAAALAPMLGAAPGAVHLRSDLERKAMLGADELERLPTEAYTAEVTRRTYERVAERAGHALAAGHTVIADAVFAKPDERAAIEAVARDVGVPFVGIWLEAAADVLKTRVATRRGDASDATVAIVEAQLGYDAGSVDWLHCEAGQSAQATRERAADIIAARLPGLTRTSSVDSGL